MTTKSPFILRSDRYEKSNRVCDIILSRRKNSEFVVRLITGYKGSVLRVRDSEKFTSYAAAENYYAKTVDDLIKEGWYNNEDFTVYVAAPIVDTKPIVKPKPSPKPKPKKVDRNITFDL